MDTTCTKFRGYNSEITWNEFYYLRITDDLKLMIDYVNSNRSKKHMYLSGFSLGANQITRNKLSRRTGDNAFQINIYKTAVNAVPFDMTGLIKNEQYLNHQNFVWYCNHWLIHMIILNFSSLWRKLKNVNNNRFWKFNDSTNIWIQWLAWLLRKLFYQSITE